MVEAVSCLCTVYLEELSLLCLQVEANATGLDYMKIPFAEIYYFLSEFWFPGEHIIGD